MRRIGNFPDATLAERFCDYLVTVSIDATFDHAEEAKWDIWVRDESQVDQARSELTEFAASPDAAKYSVKAEALRVRNERVAENQRRMKNRQSMSKKFSSARPNAMLGGATPRQQKTPAMFVILAICIGVSLYTGSVNDGKVAPSRDGQTLTPEFQLYSLLSFMDDRDVAESPGQIGQLEPSQYDEPREYFASIMRGQVWRFITPMFPHLSMMHLALNMLWMFQLGRVLEQYHGTLFFVLLVIFCQVLAMTLQVMIPHSLPAPFGALEGTPYAMGASGAVFGLLGYLWVRPQVDPSYPIRIGNQTVYFMLGWLVLCMTGLVGPIANGAHLGGLLAGMLAAALVTKYQTQKR